MPFCSCHFFLNTLQIYLNNYNLNTRQIIVIIIIIIIIIIFIINYYCNACLQALIFTMSVFCVDKQFVHPVSRHSSNLFLLPPQGDIFHHCNRFPSSFCQVKIIEFIIQSAHPISSGLLMNNTEVHKNLHKYLHSYNE